MNISSILFILCLFSLKAHQSAGSNRDFLMLQKNFTEWLLETWPQFGTQVGRQESQSKIDLLDITDFDKNYKRSKIFLDKLKAINITTENEKLLQNYELLKDYIRTYVDGYQWRMYQSLNPIYSMEGPQFELLDIKHIKQFSNKKDLQNFISRLELQDIKIGNILTRLKKAVQIERTNSAASMTRVTQDISKLTNDDSYLLQPIIHSINKSNISYPDKENYMNQTASVVERKLKPALKLLGRYIENWLRQHFSDCKRDTEESV